MHFTFKGILHGGVSLVLFTIPFVLASHSTVLDLTIGGVLTAVYQMLVEYNRTLG